MKTFILVIAMFAGPWADGDSVALTSVPGFASKVECSTAGTASKVLARSTKKEVTFVCLEQTAGGQND